jgi:hypothetical protein
MSDGSYGNREEFMRRLTQAAPQMAQQQKDEIWLLLNQALTPLFNQEATQLFASRPAGITDEEWRGSETRRGSETWQRAVAFQVLASSSCQHRYEAGETDGNGAQRSLDDIKTESLVAMGEGLTQPQREDMLRGAAQAGYSGDIVSRAQLTLQGQELVRRGKLNTAFDEQMIAQQQGLSAYLQTIFQTRVSELRRSEEARLASRDDPRIRDERERTEAELARFLGGTERGVKDASQIGQSRPDELTGVDETVARVWANSVGVRALHDHRKFRGVVADKLA